MQDSRPDRAKRTTSDTRLAPATRPLGGTRRTIDCGGAGDEATTRIRQPDRGDIPPGYVTTRGGYADQAQAI